MFRTYSKEAPDLEEIDKNKYPNFIKDTLKSCARGGTSVKTYADKDEPDIFRSFSITESKAEYGFLYYENNSKETILREKVKFGELENLKIMPPYGGDSVEVKVLPGQNELIVLNREDRGCSFNCTYYTTLIRPIEDSLREVKKTGKKNQIEYNGEKYDIFYYVYKDGSGYLWYFENESPSIFFEGTFYFKLENLEIEAEDAKSDDEWKVRLKPGESSYVKLMMKDLTKSWGYKYSYSFK